MTRDEADEALRKAILDHAEAYEITDGDLMLSEYAVVGSWQPVEANGRTFYTTQFDRPNVPTHIAVGLFNVGASLSDIDEDDE